MQEEEVLVGFLRKFTNTGRYQVVTEGGVRGGTWKVDTCLVDNQPSEPTWESRYDITPDDRTVVTSGDLDRYAYSGAGEVVSLWSKSEDPQAVKSKQVHDLIISLLRSNISPDEITTRVNYLRDGLGR